MLKYPCLVLDHDDTVVQTEKAIGFPYFRDFIAEIRPGQTLSYPQYVMDCNNTVFADMCRNRWQFTEEELKREHAGWKEYNKHNAPPAVPGIKNIIKQQKALGGLICVVSLSSRDNILRDYSLHFGIQPDAVYDCELPLNQRKPSTYPLENIMDTFHLKPEEILVVDDMKMACLMAQPLHIKTAFAAWSKADFPELKTEMQMLCDYSFDTAAELEHFLFHNV